MPIAMIGLKLLGIGKWLLSALTALFRWAMDHPWQTACILLLCSSLWLWRGKENALSDLADMTQARNTEVAAHRATKAAYRKAQAEAAELDRKNAERVKREQRAAIEQVENYYANDLSHARAAFDQRLRNAATRICSTGTGGTEAVSSVPVLSSGTVQAGGDAIVSRSDAELGLENSLRLKAVIDAWNAAAAVDPNGN